MSVVSRGNKAINERYRPYRLSELIGNEQNKVRLEAWIGRGEKRSKAVLLSGQSGGGKTTTARILAMGLSCEKGDTTEPCLECSSCKAAMNGTAFNIIECNMSETNTKEAVEEIISKMNHSALGGRNKIFILDEVQKLTNSSQNLLLKVVENPPPGTYIIFCTTEADSLIKTLQNRCEHYKYHLPSRNDISSLLKSVVKQEGMNLSDEEKIQFFNYVQGMSYREILFSLEQFSAGVEMSKLDGKCKERAQIDLFKIAKDIIYDGKWESYKTAIESGENLEFEALRQMLRTMAGKEIEKAGFTNIRRAALYHDILEEIEEKKFYESNNRPNASALVWSICAAIKDSKQ